MSLAATGSPLTSSTPAGSPLPPRGLERVRRGWLDKYSVGRGLFPVKNWQKRHFTVTSSGLKYAKTPDAVVDPRTYIPFVSPPEGPYGEVRLNPVFLLPNVSVKLHPEASDASYYYFGIRFDENSKGHILLLRTQNAAERDGWVKFISQYIHVGSSSGVPYLHPLGAGPKAFDPEELDAVEKRQLRRVVVDWDEGLDVRAVGGGAPTEAVGSPDYDSDGGVDVAAGGAPFYRGTSATPPKALTPSASAAPTPRAAMPYDETDDDIERGRSGVQPSSRSVARPSGSHVTDAPHSNTPAGSPFPQRAVNSGEFDAL